MDFDEAVRAIEALAGADVEATVWGLGDDLWPHRFVSAEPLKYPEGVNVTIRNGVISIRQ